MSKAITEKQEHVSERPRLPAGAPPRETAPSLLSEDQPGLPRAFGVGGGAIVIFFGMAFLFHLAGRGTWVPQNLAKFLLALGMGGLLFHAAFDRDVQYRRMYMIFGLAMLALGVALMLIPYPNRAGDQFRWGVLCVGVALLFLLAFLRNEDEPFLRQLAQRVIGALGLGMAVVGLLGGNVRGEFFLPTGLVLSLLGLVYLCAFVGTKGISDDLAYYVAVGVGLAGAAVVLVSLGRSLFAAEETRYFVSYGVVLLIVGLLYLATGLIMASDWPVFILTRRELAAVFYSPIAYLMLLGFGVACWLSYGAFLGDLLDSRSTAIEPIVRNYLFALFPVFTLLLIVPILTMRLLSEEMRAGTLEVLLTAPVDEPAIVTSKFLAALVSYLVLWLPFGLFLLAIPLSGGSPFDYRPLLSFLVVLVVTGAGFVSMGLFFSSLTRNQIASAVLTSAGMMVLTYIYFAAHQTNDPSWRAVLSHMSYLDLWFETLEGKIVLRGLLFPLSLTVLFLFLTVKVLESRKWR
jgi:hypothetical protein